MQEVITHSTNICLTTPHMLLKNYLLIRFTSTATQVAPPPAEGCTTSPSPSGRMHD